MPLTCAELSHAYIRGIHVLRGVSCAISPARVTAIVGPNGAGKSTLLRLLAGLLTPTSGTVTLSREGTTQGPLHRLDPADRARHIAYVAQRSSIAFAFPVRQVVTMGRHAVGRDDRAVTDALGSLDLLPLADRPFNTLSAGQQQRVSIARAIAQLTDAAASARDPRFLLADEPLAALDPRHAVAALARCRALADSDVGVVLVLHDLSAARWIADEALLLDSTGRMVASGPAPEVLTPAVLEPAFGVPFDEAPVPGRTPALLARG